MPIIFGPIQFICKIMTKFLKKNTLTHVYRLEVDIFENTEYKPSKWDRKEKSILVYAILWGQLLCNNIWLSPLFKRLLVVATTWLNRSVVRTRQNTLHFMLTFTIWIFSVAFGKRCRWESGSFHCNVLKSLRLKLF